MRLQTLAWLLLALARPALAGRVEAVLPSEVRPVSGSAASAASANAFPAPISLGVQAPTAAPLVVAPEAPSAADIAPAPAPIDVSARAQLDDGAKLEASVDTDLGRAAFDGGPQTGHGTNAAVETAASNGGRRLARPTPHAHDPTPSVPLQQRAAEAAELGAYALGFHIPMWLSFLWLGGHAAFPAAAGAAWALFGGTLIAELGKLRGKIVGGWQASHDHKMRTDYSTGRLVDIRGRKYGEDRYDEWAPGRVSPRERLAVDAAAVILGLPWVIPAGAKAVALYAAGAAAGLAARRAWRVLRPARKG